MGLVVPRTLKEEERECGRSAKSGMKTSLRLDDGVKGLKLMSKFPGQATKWKAAPKILVQDAEKHVAARGGKKRRREEREVLESYPTKFLKKCKE